MTAHSLRMVNGCPRVLDLDLNTLLGFAKPYCVRVMALRHREALEDFGPLVSTPSDLRQPTALGKRGVDLWLNREQALAVCLLSRVKQDKGSRRATVVELFQHQDVPGGILPLDLEPRPVRPKGSTRSARAAMELAFGGPPGDDEHGGHGSFVPSGRRSRFAEPSGRW